MINIIYTTIVFILLDLIFSFFNMKGVYYLNHAIANSSIVYYTLPDVIYCYTNYDIIEDRPKNYNAINMVFSLHLYHMIYYHMTCRCASDSQNARREGVAKPARKVCVGKSCF